MAVRGGRLRPAVGRDERADLTASKMVGRVRPRVRSAAER